jgi:hypothetical protein
MTAGRDRGQPLLATHEADSSGAPAMAKRTASTIERGNELRHLAQVDRYIAEVNKRIARQRALVEAAEKGRRSIEDESLLAALEASRRAFEKHRQLIVDLLENAGRLRPAK